MSFGRQAAKKEAVATLKTIMEGPWVLYKNDPEGMQYCGTFGPQAAQWVIKEDEGVFTITHTTASSVETYALPLKGVRTMLSTWKDPRVCFGPIDSCYWIVPSLGEASVEKALIKVLAGECSIQRPNDAPTEVFAEGKIALHHFSGNTYYLKAKGRGELIGPFNLDACSVDARGFICLREGPGEQGIQVIPAKKEE